MKSRIFLAAFVPFALFYALPGNASAQVMVNPVLSPHAVHVPGQNGLPGFIYHPVHSAHAPFAHYPHYPHYPVACGFNPYGWHHRPSVFVGPEVVRFSTGPGTAVSSVIDVSPRPAVARPDPNAWMNLGAPEGGPVGTWFEDAATPGHLYQYALRGDGTFARNELKRNASGPMTLVAKSPARIAFSFDEGVLVLDPEGAGEEGPYAVHMSANARGETRVTLKDAANGVLRVWRDAP